MNPIEYPQLAARTEGSYAYLRYIWTYGRCEEWDMDSEPLGRDKLSQMRFQHAVIGINTETAEVVDLFTNPERPAKPKADHRLDISHELGDVMWYTALMFRWFSGNNLELCDIRFKHACESVVNLAAKEPCNLTCIGLALQMDQKANLLLKRLKNQMFYGTVPDETVLVGWILDIMVDIVRIGNMYGLTLEEILDHNIAKLRKKFPNGFNGRDAETKRHEKAESRRHEAESKGLVYPRPLGPSVTSEQIATAVTDALRPFIGRTIGSEGTGHMEIADNRTGLVDSITHDSQPPPALPQAELAARVLDLSEYDVRILEQAVKEIRAIHEAATPETVGMEPGLVENMSSALERLGWQPTRPQVVHVEVKEDASSGLPVGRPLS